MSLSLSFLTRWRRRPGRSRRPSGLRAWLILLVLFLSAPADAADGFAPMAVPAGDPEPLTRLEVVALNGAPLDVRRYRGRAAVLYVWGEWCRACERSTPAMLDLARTHPATPFVFVNTDWPPRPLRTPPAELPDNVLQTRVDDAFFGAERMRRKRFEFPELGLVFGIPAYFLIDPVGRISARGNGSRYPPALASLLSPADPAANPVTNPVVGPRP